MAEEITIEMVPEREQRHFFRSWRKIAVLAFLCMALLAGLFSWWVANGRVSSVAASVDALIYTVEPQQSGRVENIFVHPGEIVTAGQPIARLDVTPPSALQRRSGVNGEIAARINEAQAREKEMSAKAAQARDYEENLRSMWQDLVTEQVRIQLWMRSIDPRNREQYAQARQMEEAARVRVDAAKDEFEKYSRARAAMEGELTKIRMELARNRRGIKGGIGVASKETTPPPPQPPSDLYAPVTGKIVRIEAGTGQKVQKGAPLVLILPNEDAAKGDYWIQAWFPASARGKIEPGQKVNVRLGNGESRLRGKVATVSEPETAPPGMTGMSTLEHGAKERRAALLPVRVVLEGTVAAGLLEPGRKAECQIQTRQIPGLDFFD